VRLVCLDMKPVSPRDDVGDSGLTDTIFPRQRGETTFARSVPTPDSENIRTGESRVTLAFAADLGVVQ